MTLHTVLLDQNDIEAYCRAIADRAGLAVEWKEKCTPATDGTRLIMPKIPANATNEQVTLTVSTAIHEAEGHVLKSDFDFLRRTGVNMHSTLGLVWNAVEDHRIEWLCASEYRGNARYLAEAMRILGDQASDNIKEHISKGASPPDAFVKVLAPMINWEQEVRGSVFPHYGQWGKPLFSDPRYIEIMRKLKEHPEFVRMLVEAREILPMTEGIEATYNLARDITSKIFDEDPDSPTNRPEPKEGGGKGGKKEKDGEGKGGKKEKGGEGKGTIRNGGESKKGGKGSVEVEGDGIIEVKWRPGAPKMHEPNHSGVGINIDWSKYEGTRAYQPYLKTQVVIRNYRRGR